MARVQLRLEEFENRISRNPELGSQSAQARAIGVPITTHHRVLHGTREPSGAYVIGLLLLFASPALAAEIRDLFEVDLEVTPPVRKDKALSVEEVLALPASVDIKTAGLAIGIGRTKAHELARAGEFPCPVLPVGNQYKVPKAAILAVLRLQQPEEQTSAQPATSAVA
ncbi:hypothetical protein ACIBEJ_34565 [Nonomuraea sp. NPDC050790]|uniref:hypothetical protein n=1 Tax=Nonomuraea sp. NPDC050790 TaxID=3364371 RepID=UPI0037B2B0D2